MGARDPLYPQSDNLNDWFPQRDTSDVLTVNGLRLGVVVGGSLSKGLDVKLDRETVIEDLAVGRYVVVRGLNKRFFCMITDITLDTTNPAIRSDPPDLTDQFLREIYSGTAAFGTLHVTPMLTIDLEAGEPRPVKTIPSHFMPVEIATTDDVNDVFGREDATHFNVGAPLELEETQINLDLKRLVERSVGVFGKSGTGKSFLTRILLAGIIQNDVAVNLIFDMHNDYGWAARDERGSEAKGLKQLFSSKVAIFTLDEDATRRRNAKYDHVVTIGYDDIEPEDLAMLKTTMDLSDPMIDAAYELQKVWKRDWITHLIDASSDDLDMLKEMIAASPASVQALQRRLRRFERFDFLKPHALDDSVRKIIEFIEQRKSVVLEFGRYGNALEAYILVANYLTRRIHAMYVQAVERALGDENMEPPQLLITIEEAHKFLDPLIARQTIFGTIARELRKYNVTLLVVDQRPSGIDDEVMSQVGTRVTALLDNDRDIAAVLMGISGSAGLREVLARLDTSQQAIIMGHAVPMPVVVKTRTYDTEFYRSLGSAPAGDGGSQRSKPDRESRRIR
ncbi:MAG: ATP-binding protein [Anaerolineae bacterium]|nr:ATP-binding protein [Anaerolineae bacterium]